MVERGRVSRRDAVFIIGSIILIAVSLCFGRALLSYELDIAICFRPVKLVSKEERITSAVRYLQDPVTVSRLRELSKINGGPFSESDLQSLNPKSCCKVRNKGWVGEDKVTIASILKGGISHSVDTAISNPASRARTLKISVPTTICGDVYHAQF